MKYNNKLLTLLLIFCSVFLQAQYTRSLSQSNYSGINGVHFNPANLADNRHKINVNLIGANIFILNNYFEIVTPYKQKKALSGKVDSIYLDKNGIPIFTRNMIEQNNIGIRKYAISSIDIKGPSIMVNLPDRSGIALSYRLRVLGNVSNFNPALLDLGFTNIDSFIINSLLVNGTKSKYKANININAFQQIGLSYSRIVFESKSHCLSAGITANYLRGMAAGYLKLNQAEYTAINNDSLILHQADIEVGYIHPDFFTRTPAPNAFNYFDGNTIGRGFGADIGIVYENRIAKEKYLYKMDKKEWEDRSMVKYNYKVALSFIDLGYINYSHQKYISKLHLIKKEDDTLVRADFDQFEKFNKISQFDSFFFNKFPESDTSHQFKMNLPGTFNISLDYNLKNNFFIGSQFTQSLISRKSGKIRSQSMFMIAPRYESKFLEFSFGLIFGNFYKKVQSSMHIRTGPFYIGSDNLGSLINTKKTNGFNLYFGFSVPIYYKKHKDNDDDLISNPFDKCPNEKGNPKANGCPDKDNDGIADAEDECPNAAGKKGTKGCPDEDNDKIWGKADKCPDKSGLKENAGCPDSDGDGIFDHKDKCPLVSGSKALAGCPEPKVETKPKPVETPKVEPKKDEMNFNEFDYYPVVGAFGVKENAEKFSKSFTAKSKINTILIYNKDKNIYYISTGKLTNKDDAKKVIDNLNKPEINQLINGKMWLYPQKRN